MDEETLDDTAELSTLQSTNGNNPMRNVWIDTAEKAAKDVFDERVKFFTKTNMLFSNPFDESVRKTEQKGFVCRLVLAKMVNKQWSESKLEALWKDIEPIVRLKIAKLRTSKAQACKKAFLGKSLKHIMFVMKMRSKLTICNIRKTRIGGKKGREGAV